MSVSEECPSVSQREGVLVVLQKGVLSAVLVAEAVSLDRWVLGRGTHAGIAVDPGQVWHRNR